MDTASLYQGLTFLAWTSVVFLVVIGIFLAKVLFDLSKLIGIFNQTASLVRDSAEPILADVTEAVSIINSLVKRTENNVNKFKNLSSKASKFLLTGLSKATALSGVVAKGLFSLVKSFFKK